MNKKLIVNDLICFRNNLALFLPVSFSLSEGQALHIRGPNGIGKSTLLRCLATLITPVEGDINWCGTDIHESLTYKSSMKFLGHQGSVKDSLTVFENLKWSASFEIPPSNHQVDVAVETLGLTALRHQLGLTLSSGQKQKLSLAKFFLSNTPLWILDEPINSLDTGSIKCFTSLMLDHLEGGGMVIYTSHQPLDNLPASGIELIPANH